ncbi:MAG: hypothetical protein H6606_09330 [Flavobacteriales bacterium]|nr:hypothetical protein [Flavobacteriales bacterium]
MQQEFSFYRTTKAYKNNHKTTELICENCAAPFLANRKNARFCSSSCRSQFWLQKNSKRVITLAIPADIPDSYIEEIKNMLENYRGPKERTPEKAVRTVETRVFDNSKSLEVYLKMAGFHEFKVPIMDHGIFYDDGLTIKKTEEGWETNIVLKGG